MIVPMAKVFVACRSRDRRKLLDALGEMGVIHLKPVDPERAAPDEKSLADIRDIERAVQILAGIQPAEPVADLPAIEAAREVLALQQRAAERQNRLVALDFQLRQIAVWGDVRLEQFEQLRSAGIDVKFYSVPIRDLGQVDAELVQPLAPLPGKRMLIGVVDRQDTARLPESAEQSPLPQRDAPSLRTEAAELDAQGKQDVRRLTQLAHLTDEMEKAARLLRRKVQYDVALRGAADNDLLFAVQGWAPASEAESLSRRLSAAALDAAVQAIEADPDEHPPTLIRYPRWAQPINGLLQLLGTTAGHREFDVSRPFMIALPIFAAMLIADGGYGALLCLGLGLGYRKAAQALGREFTHLLLVIGAVTVVWGVVTASFFGAVVYKPLIPVDLTEYSRSLLMKVSFYMGAIHLAIAQLMQAAALYPNTRFLNRVGWAVFIWGALGVVMHLVLNEHFGWDTVWPYLLIAGATLAVLFQAPSAGWIMRIVLGLANFPLAMLSAFSDVISYVRLMAVGLASSVLGANFNELAGDVGFWPLALLILLFGHGLNMGLAMIALFAHGVRLNMLEFSNNLGMQWTGYPFRPFVRQSAQEA